MIEHVVNVLEKERDLFEKLRKSISRQRDAMLAKRLDEMEAALNETEKLVFEIGKIDEERHKLFDLLKKKAGLPSNAPFETLLFHLKGEEREAFENSVTKFLWTLNELAQDLQGIKDVLEFENSYFEFLMNLIHGESSNATYSKKGEVRAETEGIFDARW